MSFQEVVWLDSNHTFNSNNRLYPSFDALLAVDAYSTLKVDSLQAFDMLENYKKKVNDWLFGYLSYDLKNSIYKGSSKNIDGLEFPGLYFFQPKKIFLLKENVLEIQYLNEFSLEMDADLRSILTISLDQISKPPSKNLIITERTTRESYLEKVKQLQYHIQQGDLYEANFCMEFYSENSEIDPWSCFQKLNEISTPPFAALVKLDSFFILSASPERYLKKIGDKIISQPIKGTSRRATSKKEDKALIKMLKNSIKERSENIMITDLVRNDLSQTASRASVNVEELCEVYTFKQVHHLISTITSQINTKFSSVDVIKSTFPMGSMTGAPKESTMQLIEKFEDAKRGVYSGSVGYFTPDDDFDFNVVIRSILYNKEKKYVSFSVGSAITINSVPELEYEECLLKANAMRKVLQ